MKNKSLKLFKRVILTILISVPYLLLGQELNLKKAEKTFLPEAYVKSILSTHRLKSIKMFKEQPIEAIVTRNKGKYLKTYGGKETLVSIKKTSLGKIELLYVNKLLNLMYFQEDDFKNAKFFISQVNENLSLDIVDKGMRDTITFVSSIKGYEFETPTISYVKLLLSGSYELLDKGKKSSLTFNLNGSIKSNGDWSKYSIGGVNLVDRDDSTPFFFHSITLISKKGDRHLNLAFTYLDDTKSWEGFSYETVKGNTIVLTKDRTIKLIRN